MRITRIASNIFLVPLLGFLSIGSSVEKKICFNVSKRHICYFQPKEDLTWEPWDTAWNICQNNNATLPIIENKDVQKIFEEYLRNISLNNNEIWLGGRQLTKKWIWSNKKLFYQPELIMTGDENPRTQAFIRRTSDSVSPSNATLRYVAGYPSWSCYYICQYSDSQCPAENSTIQKEHNSCLKVFRNQELNASEATTNCNKSGGHLAIFDGDEFLTKAPKVYQQMQPYRSPYYPCYFIGLHRNDTKSWFWMRSNNENSAMEGNYDNWSDRNNRANGECLFATANDHKWKASGCDTWKDFICQTTPTTTDSTSRKSTTATTAGNSHTTTVKIDSTINSYKDDSSTTVPAPIGAGVVIVILCIIVILVVIWRKSKSSNNKTEPAEKDPKNTKETKDKKTKENKSSETTEERSIYADISLAERTANDAPKADQKGTVYASLDFNQGVTYVEPSKLYANTQNVSGQIYAEPLNATGNKITSAGSSPAIKIGPMGDVYALPTTNVTPSSDKMTERPIYANT